MSKQITLRPLVNSEKAYAQSAKRVYVFEVDRGLNKHNVARAVESQFDVKVTEVNTTNISGKAKRVVSILGKRTANSNGKRNDVKKAYVTLAEGYSLPFFEAVDEAIEKEQAAETKLAAKAEKAAKPARRGLLRGKADKAADAKETK